jgi:tRNA(Ser,Leu) C12 N-acetylase TAN1
MKERIKPLEIFLCYSKDELKNLIMEILREIKKEKPESFREKIKQKGQKNER